MSDLSISGVSGSSSLQQNQWTQRKNAFDELGKALQSGDLAAAQKAFGVLQQNVPAKASARHEDGASQGSFAALAQALQSGDLAGAQQAFAQVQQGRGHHHHHHHAQAGTSSGSSASTAVTSDSGIGSTGVNLTA